MKGTYPMLAAVFITLMLSPAAYSTEPSNMSMDFFKEMESNVTVYVDANSSDEKLSVWDIPVSELTSAECSYGGRTAPSTKKKSKNPYSIRFESGSFTPTERLDSRIRDKLASAGENDYTYCFVMVSERITDANRSVLTENGVKLLGYQFYHSHKAKIPLNRIEELENLSFVRWVGYAPFDLKIHPILQKKISSGSDDEIRVYIKVFDSDINEKSEKIVHGGETQYDKQYYTYITHGPFQNKLEEMGVTILDYEERYGRVMFTARATPDTINRIAGLDFVLFIKSDDPDANLPMITTVSNQRSPNTDEPLEPEELTMGDSNPGIITIVRMTFAYIQSRLI